MFPEDPLPPPKVHREVDSGRGDFELFQQYVLPSGGLCAIGDMWDDVARSDVFSTVMLVNIPVN